MKQKTEALVMDVILAMQAAVLIGKIIRNVRSRRS